MIDSPSISPGRVQAQSPCRPARRLAADREVTAATAEADFGAEPSEELAAQRRSRYLAQVRAQGGHLRTGAEILAWPPESADPPSDEELLAFLDVIYDARRVDA
jgi:hypothetical protein